MMYQYKNGWAAVSALLFFTLMCDNARAACSVPSFGTGATLAVGTQPLSVGIGDFNNDGKSDLAVANFTSNDVSILLRNGTGGFGTATNVTAGTNPSAIAVADLNGDGNLDLAISNAGSDNVSVLLGDGAGHFGSAANFFVGANPSAIVISDFNNDGKADLAVANADTNNVSILLGNGMGGFGAATDFIVGFSPVALAVGDFNGDGVKDIAVADFFYDGNGNNVSILLGDGAGRFIKGGELYAGTSPIAIAVGDFNGDGKIDLAVVNTGSYDVSIFIGDGAGAFAAQVLYDVGTSPTSIAVGDFNGDNKLDLAVTNGDSNNVSVLLGNGNGGFSAAGNFNAGTSPSSVSIGDFNSDGITDLAVANANSNNVSILLNACGAQPILLIDETTGRAAALDSVTLLPDPFSVFNTYNFSTDQRTRIMLFAINVAPGETASTVTAQAVDSQNIIYSMPIEFIGTVPNYNWITEIVVRMPDQLTNLVAVQVSINVRGVAGNKVLIDIRQ
jgi:hypothetical protein